MKKHVRIAPFFLALLVLAVVVGFVLTRGKKAEPIEISYIEVIQQMELDNVAKLEMTEGSKEISLKLKNDESGSYVATVPSEEIFLEYLQEKVISGQQIAVKINEEESSFSFFDLIWLAYLGFLGYSLFRMISSSKKSLDSFKPSSLTSLFNTNINFSERIVDSNITFRDVAGLDVEKEELWEIVDFLRNPEKYTKLGAKIPKGVLLAGSPGTGKTLLAKAVAGEAGVKFLALSGSDFVEMYVGVGASRVRNLFKEARKNAPCIIFIDEIDAVGGKRSEASSNSEREQTIEQLLIEMDGFDTSREVIVIAATNRPDSLDPALVRPGRFDRRIEVGLPDRKGREDILRIHARDKKFVDDVNFTDISLNTPGYSGAELENLLNEAALFAARNNHEAINKSDIYDALKKITVGLQKTGKIVSPKERRLTAYHEAGHAVVSLFLETQTSIKEVSIIPRGGAGGYTWHNRTEDHNYASKAEMSERLVVLMGGRAAEDLILKDISSGASNDIKVATQTAKAMIGTYGMDSEIGPVAITELDYSEQTFFGDSIFNNAGEKTAKILKEAEEKAKNILKENQKLLEALAELLLCQETVTGEELKQLASKFNTKVANA